MASRSWNRTELIGNLTRDPELRYIPSGTAVATFGVATNRVYVSEGERKEEVDFHRIVAWSKLAELCSQLLKKGSRVFISGRLQYHEWETQEGGKRRDAEIVLEDMILLTSRNDSVPAVPEETTSEEVIPSDEAAVSPPTAEVPQPVENKSTVKESAAAKSKSPKTEGDEIVDESDLPF